MKPIDGRDFAVLLKRHKDALLAYTMTLIPVREDAEDVCQRSFEKAFVNIEKYDSRFAFSTWLYNIARNEAIDHLRRVRTSPSTVSLNDNPSDADVLDPDTPENQVISGQRVQQITSFISSLPETYRQVAELRFIKDYSYEDIAEELGIPIGTVKTRINRARKALSGMTAELSGSR